MRRRKKTNQSSKPTTEADEDEYEPTPAEAEALWAYATARNTRAARIKVTGKDVRPDHPNWCVAQVALMKAIGTTDADFYSGLLSQLINVGSPGREPDEAGTNFMLAIVKGIEPRDQIEAMLAAQMGAVHLATMTFARRLNHVENIPQQDSAERAFNKLTRTFAAQMAALKEYRSKGEQRMIVQHVNVSGGGQAIVGAVNGPPEGGRGARKKWRTTPCSWICAGRHDAAPIRSGAGSRAKRQRFGAMRFAGCTARAAARREAIATR